MATPQRVLLWIGVAAALAVFGVMAASWLHEDLPDEPLDVSLEDVEGRATPPKQLPQPGPAVERPKPPPRLPETEGGSVTGRIVRIGRQPVAGARIEALRGANLGIFLRGEADSLQRRTVTDSEGGFRLEDVPATGDLLLRLDGDDFASTDFGPFVVSTGRTTSVGDLVVTEGLTILGSVVDPNRRPVAGATLGLHFGMSPPPLEAKPARVTLSDEAGRFQFLHAPASGLSLDIQAPGFARMRRQFVPQPGQAQHEWLVRVEVEPVHPLSGRVLALPDLKPVAGALIEAQALDAHRAGGVSTTDADGRFEITGLAFGNYNITAIAKGYCRKSERTWAERGEDSVELRLAPAGSVAGTVLGSDGRPVAHFDLQARFHSDRHAPPSPRGNFRRISSSQGRFVLDDLEPGFWCVAVWAKGYAVSESRCLRVHQGEQLEGLDVTLQLGAALTGRVVDDSGQAVPGAIVSLHPNREPEAEFLRQPDGGPLTRHRTVTDSDGRFRLDELTAQRVQVQVDHPDYAVVRRDDIAIPAQAELELEGFVLERTASVEGVALDRAGVPLTGVVVRLYRIGGMALQVTTDGGGAFRFPRVRAGDYQLTCEGRGGGLFSMLEYLHAGTGPDTLQLRPGDAVQRNVVALP
ncbi:MAG: carboxypeptidase regulatory-like domain-containing protein [Planctomycetota bacterium]